jgi:hypothetical protein
MSSNDGINTRKWRRIRLAILERDEHTCAWCGREATTVDHLVARVDGGGHDPSNLVASCVTCNSRRGQAVGARRRRARRRGSSAFIDSPTTPTSSSLFFRDGVEPILGGNTYQVVRSGADGRIGLYRQGNPRHCRRYRGLWRIIRSGSLSP